MCSSVLSCLGVSNRTFLRNSWEVGTFCSACCDRWQSQSQKSSILPGVTQLLCGRRNWSSVPTSGTSFLFSHLRFTSFCLEKRRGGTTKGRRTDTAAGRNPGKGAVSEPEASSAARSAQRRGPGVGRTVWVKSPSQDWRVLVRASTRRLQCCWQSPLPGAMQDAVLFGRKWPACPYKERFCEFSRVRGLSEQESVSVPYRKPFVDSGGDH